MIRDIVQRTDEWHAWRRLGITATVTANILGYGYRTPWQEWALYMGRIDPQDLSGNPFVRKGVELEDYVRMLWEDRHDDVALPVCVEWDKDPVFRASLDGMDSNGVPVEFKVINGKAFEYAKQYGTASLVYLQYWTQVQHQLLCTEADYGYLAMHSPDYQQNSDEEVAYIEFKITRDDQFIRDEMIPSIKHFWDYHIGRKKEPALDVKRDIYIPSGDRLDRWRKESRLWLDLNEQYQSKQKELDNIRTQQTEVEKRILELMGDYRQVYGYRLQATRYRRKGTIDYKRLVEERLDLTPLDLEAYRRPPGNAMLKITPKEAKGDVIDIAHRLEMDQREKQEKSVLDAFPLASF